MAMDIGGSQNINLFKEWEKKFLIVNKNMD